uniref:Uncharacterized protein n=1 Tax=Rhipicephalus zambeziensis TaxID=60191 RepID=A0A224Y4Y1_9ACAR
MPAFPRNSSLFLPRFTNCVFIMVHLSVKKKCLGTSSLCANRCLCTCRVFYASCVYACHLLPLTFGRAALWLRWVLFQTVKGTLKSKVS